MPYWVILWPFRSIQFCCISQSNRGLWTVPHLLFNSIGNFWLYNMEVCMCDLISVTIENGFKKSSLVSGLDSFYFNVFKYRWSPAVWGSRRHSLYLCRGVRLYQRVSWIRQIQSDGEIPVKLELWGMRCTSLSYLPNPSARAGYDTRSIFKRSLTGFNSEFSFS